MKILIFDAGTLINFGMNGLTSILANLRKTFNGKFIITNDVKSEVVDRPLTIKKYELGALKVDSLIEQGILEYPESIGINDSEIKEKAKEIIEIANNAFFSQGKFLHLIDKGETSCLALSLIASEKNIQNIITIDERTTRMLSENPNNLKKLMESKLHTTIRIKKDISFLKDISFIRSAELVYISYKKNLIKINNKNLLDALLYAVKYRGCSISKQEIEEIKRIN